MPGFADEFSMPWNPIILASRTRWKMSLVKQGAWTMSGVVIFSTFTMKLYQMDKVRFRLILLVVPVILLLFAGSCGPQKYSSRSTSHPKKCNCPSFK